MRILFFFVLNIVSLSVTFSNEIDYEHRALLKALDKMNNNSELTEIHIPQEFEIQLNGEGKYFQTSGNEIAYVYVGRVNSCRSGGCSAPGVDVNTSFEYFDYYIFYDSRGAVEQVKIFNYQATHGQEITLKRDWLSGTASGRFLRDVRNGACELFNLVLSPDYNADHADHLHFDMGRYRSCR